MEMEGRVYSDFYRNTSEEIFMKTLMESSVGTLAPTMEMMRFKNLSNNFRADSEELFKRWLTTAESQDHNSTNTVHNCPRQLSRMLNDQSNLPSHQNGVPLQTKTSNENLTPQSPLAVGEFSCDMNEHSVRNLAERGLQASNLHFSKARFNSSQPMTRSHSSELRRKYVAMQNSQTEIGSKAMHYTSRVTVNHTKQDFVNPSAFNEASVFDDFMSTSNSSSSTVNVPQIDKVSSVVSMLRGSLERRKLGNHVVRESTADSSVGYYYPNLSKEVFQDLTTANVDDPMLIQRFLGAMDADMEYSVAPTNVIQTNITSREPSQSETSAAAPVITTGFDVSNEPSNSGHSPSLCQSPRKQAVNVNTRENGCITKDIKERMYDNLKEDHKHNGSLTRHGSVTCAGSGDREDPTKKRRVVRSRKMAEAKERTQTPATPSDMQSVIKRCENLEKEVRSLKLNLAFMNRKDSEQTKQIEELQKQNEDMGGEKKRLSQEIERILSRPIKM